MLGAGVSASKTRGCSLRDQPRIRIEKEIATMNVEQQKERALTFLKNLEKPDAKVFENIIADDFEFEMMGRLPGINPIRGKDAFLKGMPSTLKAMFPNGLNLKFGTAIAEGAHVAIQAESDTTAANGKK